VAPLAQVAWPVVETVTSLVGVGSTSVHAPQVALWGMTVAGAMLQWPVAVNCTAEPFALIAEGLTLRDSSCRFPETHPTMNIAAASKMQINFRGDSFITFLPARKYRRVLSAVGLGAEIFCQEAPDGSAPFQLPHTRERPHARRLNWDKALTPFHRRFPREPQGENRGPSQRLDELKAKS